MASAARSRWIIAGALVLCIFAAWWIRRRPQQQYPIAYVADRSATVWSSTAQVRQTVATLGYGDRVAVLQRSGDDAEVRTNDGSQGWLDAHMLMDSAMWKQVADLLTSARTMPVQAIGHTRAISNVHLQAGRDATRIFQFGRGVPVFVLERKVLPVPQTPAAAADEGSAPDTDADAKDQPKQEDWLLVLRAPQPDAPVTAATDAKPAADGADTPIAGWVLGRFISLDAPQPIPDYTSSAAMRLVGWQVLNTVPADGGDKPQYLVVGTHGGEGQPCDFTLMRVYTWSAARMRYETAYIESNLCGALPIVVRQTPDGPEFRFAEIDEGGAERVYRMKQTSVRRVKDAAQARADSDRR